MRQLASLSRFAPRWGQNLAQAVIALSAGVALVACGGGGTDATSTETTTTTASAYTSGVITGFGSIIVNGLRFDDSSASVLDAEGHATVASALKLGTTVTIDSTALDRVNGKSTATRIRLGASLLGPVEALDATAGTLTVLGQAVTVSDTTVFDSTLSGGLSAVTVGSVIEVHGLPDATTGAVAASRVESETGATSYRLPGTVASLDSTAKTFKIGSATVNYASATNVSSSLADGVKVMAVLQTSQVSGQWVATSVLTKDKPTGSRPDADVHGTITAWTSATSFTVNDVVVDASSATFPNGQTGVVLGAKVHVAGSLVSGVLVATEVRVDDSSHSSSSYTLRHELHGLISALDTTAKTFTLRGLTVDYSSVTTWQGLTESSLANNLKVEVKGSLSSDGTKVVAKQIKLDN